MSLYDLSLNDIQTLLNDKPFRAKQVQQYMYLHLGDFSKTTSLPKPVLEKLTKLRLFQPALKISKISSCDSGKTEKFLFSLTDQYQVESVLMTYSNRSTACISSQVGCKMNCKFCATGQMGYLKNLTRGEIIEQVIKLMYYCKTNDLHPISNIVFMGMGEPFDNYDNCIDAAFTIKDQLNIGASHITLSTVGIVPSIKKYIYDQVPFRLAVSLHAADDETRSKIVPINKKYPISELVDTLKEYANSKFSKRLSLEWTLIENINDTPDQAKKLSFIARTLNAHVNLINLNRISESKYAPTTVAKVDLFKQILLQNNVNVTVRQTRGQLIDAACGQLALQKT